jgi:flagellar biosynthesis protein FlhG
MSSALSTTPSETPPSGDAAAGNRKIIAIASGKGGVGKTWCSISLCQGLSEAGGKILLFDGDLGLANVDIQLGLMPKYDISKVINGDVPLRQARIPYLDGGFDIIAGRSGTSNLANLPAGVLARLRDDLNALGSSYDKIVLDLGAGIDRTVRTLAMMAAVSVVIITPEPTSLTDSYAYIKVLCAKPPFPDIRIVVNMADSKEDGEKAYKTLLKACQSFLKFSPPLLGIIRRDRAVNDSIRRQVPIFTAAPNSNAALDVKGIASLLL